MSGTKRTFSDFARELHEIKQAQKKLKLRQERVAKRAARARLNALEYFPKNYKEFKQRIHSGRTRNPDGTFIQHYAEVPRSTISNSRITLRGRVAIGVIANYPKSPMADNINYVLHGKNFEGLADLTRYIPGQANASDRYVLKYSRKYILYKYLGFRLPRYRYKGKADVWPVVLRAFNMMFKNHKRELYDHNFSSVAVLNHHMRHYYKQLMGLKNDRFSGVVVAFAGVFGKDVAFNIAQLTY